MTFEDSSSEAVCRLQDVPIEEAASDIEKYLNAQLPKLTSSVDLAELGHRAGSLFIYAAIAVKCLTPRRSMTSKERSRLFNQLLSELRNFSASGSAVFLIDELYRQIMYKESRRLEEFAYPIHMPVYGGEDIAANYHSAYPK